MTSYRRLLYSILAFTALFALSAAASKWIFQAAEGRHMSFVEALLFVSESITSTGFGSFIPFRSPQTMAWAIFLMMAGFVTMAVWFGAVIGDWMSTRLTLRPANCAPRNLQEHVIICGTGPIAHYLVGRCREYRVPYIIIGQDRAVLLHWMESGHRVMEGDPRKLETLRNARIGAARSVVPVMADADNAGICLAARSLRADIPIYASLENKSNEPFLQAAGVTKSIMIKRSLGLRLGFLSSHTQEGQFSRLFGEVEGVSYASMAIKIGTPLIGNLAQARIEEKTGAVPLGTLSQGRFRPATEPTLTVQPGDMLISVGSQEAIARLCALAQSKEHTATVASKEVLVLGFGDAGKGAAEFMEREHVPFRVLTANLAADGAAAQAAGARAWFEGDAMRHEDLVRAGIHDVAAVVIALPDDSAAVFTTLIIRQLNPTVRIVVRANSLDAVEQLHTAGADSVLDISTVGGVVLARHVLPVEISPMGLEWLKLSEVESAMPPDGRLLAIERAQVRSRCRLVALRKVSGELQFVTGARVRVSPGDHLILFGTEPQQAAFRAQLHIG